MDAAVSPPGRIWVLWIKKNSFLFPHKLITFREKLISSEHKHIEKKCFTVFRVLLTMI